MTIGSKSILYWLGLLIAALGVIGAITIVQAVDGSSAQTWSAVLPALAVVALGGILSAVGTVIDYLVAANSDVLTGRLADLERAHGAGLLSDDELTAARARVLGE